MNELFFCDRHSGKPVAFAGRLNECPVCILEEENGDLVRKIERLNEDLLLAAQE